MRVNALGKSRAEKVDVMLLEKECVGTLPNIVTPMVLVRIQVEAVLIQEKATKRVLLSRTKWEEV